MSIEQAYNFKRISEQVSSSGVISEQQLQGLAAEGFEALINLLPADSEYAVPDEPAIVADQGLAYTYIPVDFAAPNASDYALFESALVEFGSKKLMIHCAANYRVSAFYGIYAYRQLGWPANRVYAHIASIWDLGEHPVWKAFVENMLD